MFLRTYGLSVGMLAFAGTSRAASYNFDVTPSLLPVDQGSADLCWLAATAVIMSYKDNALVSMSAAATRLGPEFVIKQSLNSRLNYSDLNLWKMRGNFLSEGQQCIDAKGWYNLLKKHGPLITLVDGSGSSTIDRAVVVSEIHGDGSLTGTKLTFANSQGGVMQSESLADFVTIFEKPQGNDALFSVMYF
jgi:hypothetical protein